jgi:hypothetical protein
MLIGQLWGGSSGGISDAHPLAHDLVQLHIKFSGRQVYCVVLHCTSEVGVPVLVYTLLSATGPIANWPQDITY